MDGQGVARGQLGHGGRERQRPFSRKRPIQPGPADKGRCSSDGKAKDNHASSESRHGPVTESIQHQLNDWLIARGCQQAFRVDITELIDNNHGECSEITHKERPQQYLRHLFPRIVQLIRQMRRVVKPAQRPDSGQQSQEKDGAVG